MTTKHTPGPWQVVAADKAEHPWVVGDAEGGSVASCEPMGPWMSGTEASANARLIASAPELLAALKALLQANDDVQTALCDGPDVPGWDRSALPRAQANVTAAEAVAKAIIAKAGV